MWYAHTGELVRSLAHEDIGKIHCITLLKNLHLAVGTQDGSLFLWDVFTGKLIYKLQQHSQPIYAIDYSKQKDQL